MDLLLGLDIGSTVVKAAVFDRRGRIVAHAAKAVPVHRPQPGWVERDADATWRAVATVLRQIVCGRARKIAAVGVTGCGNGAVFLDRALRPLRAGILSSDQRAADFLPRRDDPRRGQRVYAGQLRFLLAWLRASESSAVRRLAHAVFWKDFVRARLTGTIGTDPTDAGAAGLLDYPARTLRERDVAVPPIYESLGLAGTITRDAARETGLVTGTPVVTGCIDCEAAALGSGVHAPGEVSIVAGTWSINQTYMTKPPRYGPHFLVNVSVESGRWLVLEGSPSSVANFDWARRILGNLTAEQAVAEAARAPASSLLFLPQVPDGRGVFVGLEATHERRDLLRAVMQGIVFAHRAHLEKLPVRPRRVALAGGAARSPFWCQLFADGLGCRVDVPRCEQLGARGAALCAGIGVGLWPTVVTAQRAMTPPRRRYFPRATCRTALNRKYARFGGAMRSPLLT